MLKVHVVKPRNDFSVVVFEVRGFLMAILVLEAGKTFAADFFQLF